MNRNIKRTLLFLVVIILGFKIEINSQIPKTLSYQGVLSDTSGIYKTDGEYSFTFSFYELSSGGVPIWSETKSLHIKQGYFSTLLGEEVPFGEGIQFDRQYWLGIQIGDESELTPRVPLSSVGYSFSSLRADTAKFSYNSIVDTIWSRNEQNIYYLNGNIGIGTSEPIDRLSVEGGKILIKGDGSWFQGLKITNSSGRSVLTLSGNITENNLSSTEMVFEDINRNRLWGFLHQDDNNLSIYSRDSENNYYRPIVFNFAAPTNTLVISSEGNVGIGVEDPVGHKLAVNGSIISEEVIVKLQEEWPDFVFNKEYLLPTLDEVEEYVSRHNHLPGMPDSSFVAEKGITLGSFNSMLLRKVEELTLYLIDQNKRIQELEELNRVLLEKFDIKSKQGN
ncbi:hypothetical protein ACFLS9_05510 [Bacteroidota bacterium]